jgi:hypothetical protein
MAKLTEAEMIARYDAMKSGSLWTKIVDVITNDDAAGDTPLSDTEAQAIHALYPDIPLSAGEQRCLDILLNEGAVAAWIDRQREDTDTMIAILEELDGGDEKLIDERFDRVVDAIAELPEAQRAQAIALWEGFLAGVAAQ